MLSAALPAEVVTSARAAAASRRATDVATARFTDGTRSRRTSSSARTASIRRCARSLFGPDAPRFTGKICYRSLVPVDAVPGGPEGEDAAPGLDPTAPSWCTWCAAVSWSTSSPLRRRFLARRVLDHASATARRSSTTTGLARVAAAPLRGQREAVQVGPARPRPAAAPGRAAGLRSSATRRIRCCPTWARAPARPWRTAACWPRRWHRSPDDVPARPAACTSACGGRGPARWSSTSRERGVDNHLTSPARGLAARSHDRRAKADRLRSRGPWRELDLGTTTPAQRARSPHEAPGGARRGRSCARLLRRRCTRRELDRQARVAIGLDPRGCDADGASPVPGCAEVRQCAEPGRW